MNKSSEKTPDRAELVILDGMPPEITGQYLREERIKLGLTQDRMARLFRVTLNTYSRWERGRFLPHAAGAIWLALEHLKFKLSLSNIELLRDLDQRLADAEAAHKRLQREREEFSRSLKK